MSFSKSSEVDQHVKVPWRFVVYIIYIYIYQIWLGKTSLLEFFGLYETSDHARSGPCTIMDGCIQSPNYPGNYSQMLKSMPGMQQYSRCKKMNGSVFIHNPTN